MNVYKFEVLKNIFDAGLEPLQPAIFHELTDDAYAVAVADRILDGGTADLVRVSEVITADHTRLVKEVFA